MTRRHGLLAAFLLAAACGGDHAPVMPTNTKTVPTVPERYQRRSLATWRSLAGDLPAEERAAQVWALSVLEKDPQASLDVLLARLDDPDPGVRLAAIVATGRLAPSSPRAAERLVRAFASPQEPLRRHARVAVGKLGAVALGPLQDALGAEDVRVRWAAVSACADLGAAGAPAVPTVRRIVAEDPNASIRRQARFTLARLGPQGIAASVARLREAEPIERAEISAALARAGAAVAKPMAALLADKDGDLAARAAGVLADLGPEAQPVLDDLLAALEREGPVRFNAAEALLAIGAPAIERVTPLARSDNEDLAGIAQYILDTWAER